MKVKSFTVTIPSDLLEWLREYKQEKCVSLSALVTKLLTEWRASNDFTAR